MPETKKECLRAQSRRDLANHHHAARSLRASLDRRRAAVRRRRLSRAGRSAVAVTAALLMAGSAGAVAQQSAGGSSQPRAAASAGYDVRALQRKLGVTADGIVGPQTRRAIRRFQRRSGLTVDGVVGPATLEALRLDGLSATPPAAPANAPRSASSRLEAIARCESGGDPAAVSADGRYRGKYQFSRATWRGMGGKGDPAAAPEAEQDRLAALLLKRQGPSAWPNCAR